MGWTTQLTWSAGAIEQRRSDALRLLKQVPAITELAQLDPTGKERLRVSRLVMDLSEKEKDYSHDPKFTEAVAKKVYYGPVYFRRQSEPYMTLSVAGTRLDAGVSVAEVGIKLIWDVVSQIKVGEHGLAYVIDADGRLIAHPDISLVLRNTDMSKLAQIQAVRPSATKCAGCRSEAMQEGQDLHGAPCLRSGLAAGLARRRRASSRRSLRTTLRLDQTFQRCHFHWPRAGVSVRAVPGLPEPAGASRHRRSRVRARHWRRRRYCRVVRAACVRT
jgi:hypothetical protein